MNQRAGQGPLPLFLRTSLFPGLLPYLGTASAKTDNIDPVLSTVAQGPNPPVSRQPPKPDSFSLFYCQLFSAAGQAPAPQGVASGRSDDQNPA
ncbi:hypothetical protein [Desulfuromonas thiophila]|uniref:hypothetical protein n=1 Tax=Desulfuromonas thiophila TaxID=57664 RepID=UPI00115FB4EF|nr:hypothetical protein [Desulfuromonas thiophila]